MTPQALPDSRGHFGPFGGMFVPETLMAALRELEAEYLAAREDPEFQKELDRLLHEPNNLATRRQIRDWIMESLGRWERRIVLDRVEVLELPDQPAELRVEIAYRLARTGTPGALAVTVRLEDG